MIEVECRMLQNLMKAAVKHDRKYIPLLKSDIAKLEAEKTRLTEYVESMTDYRHREVARLRLLEGMTHEEIAARMNYNVRTIKKFWKEMNEQCPK